MIPYLNFFSIPIYDEVLHCTADFWDDGVSHFTLFMTICFWTKLYWNGQSKSEKDLVSDLNAVAVEKMWVIS